MEIVARPKPLADGQWRYSCGFQVGHGAYCPGKVAMVGKDSDGAWAAKPPTGWVWRKRDGRYIGHRSQLPNRGDPDPESRYLPRRRPETEVRGNVITAVDKGGGPIYSMGPIQSPRSHYPRLPLIALCDRGHHNLLAAPSTVQVQSL